MIGKWILISLLTPVLLFSLESKQSPIVAVVSGIVIDADKEPVSGAQVSIMGNRQRGQRPFEGHAATSEKGEFAFEDIPDGSYRIMVMSPDLGRTSDQLEVEGNVK